jgi:hypothetical protein
MPGYWNSKSDIEVKNEITSQLSIKSLDFIGRYRMHPNGFTFFDNIRLPNFSPLPKIKSNKDGKLTNAKIILHLQEEKDLKKGSYYRFTSKVIPQILRIKHNKEFIFAVDNDFEIIEYKPNEKEFIESIFERFDKADSANNNDISKALNTITYQINKKPETFIYELLQNADDNAGNRDVYVTFYITEKYLLVSHNGDPFKFNNVFAICSVNAEDKSEDIDKIGFKGIGFKSVFKDNDWVFINSGEYSFRFDQSIYSVEKPWQLMPIWTPIDDIELDKTIKNNQKFLLKNVSIALRPKNNDIKLLSKYSDTLKLFSDDRILLFLKKVKQVHVSLQNNDKIHCEKNNTIWDIRDYTIKVNTEIKNWLNEQIRNNNQEVPIKYQDIGKFKISYAYKFDIDKVLPLFDSTLFNYLPLSISLGFPFLVNSDFIPDGDREELYLNTWNEYIMLEIGRCLPRFISDIVNQKSDCLNLLPETAKNNFLNSKWNQLYEWFLQGYVESLIGESPIAFIPSKSGPLETLSNILIDETGLAELLGDEFSQLTGISEKLIDSKVGGGIEKIKDLINQNNVGVIYDTDRIKDDIKTKLQDWLKQPTNNFKFIEHLFSNDSLKNLLSSEEIILSSDGELFYTSKLYAEVPEEITFLSPKQANNEVLNFIKEKNIKLEFKKFEPVQFLSENIVGKEVALNVVLDNETKLLHFWQFVFNNWEELESDKATVNCLKHIKILCKSSIPNEILECAISKSYLSSEYNISNEIESTVKDFIQDAHFISDKYITKKGDEIKWRKIFNKLGVISDLQKTIDDLLPKLSSFNDQQHFIITKQIFKFWRDNKEKETRLIESQLALIKNNLRLKCTDNIFRVTFESIISDDYQTNKIIDSTLPAVRLPYLIASDYSNTQISEWNTFFKEIGCDSLEDMQQVLNEKISYFVDYQDEENLLKEHFNILKEISKIYESAKNKRLEIDFNTLSKIKLKIESDLNSWKTPNNIHFSKIYNPKLNIQGKFNYNLDIDFLNSSYNPEEISFNLLKKIGLRDNFEFKFIKSLNFKNYDNIKIKNTLFNGARFKNRKEYFINRGNSIEDVQRYTSFHNHIECYPKLNISLVQKFNKLFFSEINKLENFYFDDTFIVNNNYKYDSCNNNLINFIKDNEIFENEQGSFVKSNKIIVRDLQNYINDNSLYLKNKNFLNAINEKALEEKFGFQKELTPKQCIELLKRTKNQLNLEEITKLNIINILKAYEPKGEEKLVFFPNFDFKWKPIKKLFTIQDNSFQLESSHQLHNHFYPLAENFGIDELSEENLTIKTIPNLPEKNKEIITFLIEKAKFISFKIDQTNWMESETEILEHLSSFEFYEVESVSKNFPKVKPIYEENLDFCVDEEMKVFYKGNWNTNEKLLEFLYSQISNDNNNKAWFKNVIKNSWDNNYIISHLAGDFPDVIPPEWRVDLLSPDERTEVEQKPAKTIKDILPDASEEEIAYISEIINVSWDKDGQIDANTNAKIKTLKFLKSNRDISNIIDKGRYLQLDSEKIIVRSAQKGLLYLDLYDWSELNEENVKIAIYTKSEITIFDSQDALFQFCKPQNTFGVLRMPNDYNLDDFNNLDDIKEKSKWHFVFIVNKDAKAAQSYKEIMNLDDYNF